MSGPWEKYQQPQQDGPWARFAAAAPAQPAATGDEPGMLVSAAAALGKGTGNVALGAQHWLGRGIQALGDAVSPDETTLTSLVTGSKPRGAIQRAGDWLVNDAAAGRAKLTDELAPYKAANPTTVGVSETAGEIASTLPVSGLLAKPVQWLAGAGVAPKVLAPLATAIQTSGMTAGGVRGAAGLATRTAGGAITGGASAGLVNPDDVEVGALIGGALPGAVGVVKRGAQAVGGLLRPFTQRGQERIVGDTLRQFATDPEAAARAMAQASEVIPGSAPGAVAASGDVGLAGLSRTLQSVSPTYAAELTARQASQNAARTAALEAIAGNPGKIATAKEARDAATAAMRESALDAAGQIPSQAILSRLDTLLSRPDNAGRIVQQALGGIRNQLAGVTDQAGNIDPRALYAVRKDINDILGGKLQGEAGNLRFASSQLIAVKNVIDNLIDMAGKRMTTSAGRSVMPNGGQLARPGAVSAGAARTSWRDYLSEYARQSAPINQMERLQDVLQRIQTGTVDANGSLVLSAPKLNNLLKTEGQDLMKELAPEQLDLLRRLAADLNASQLSQTAGRAVGSDTVQKLGSGALLKGALGKRLGGSTPATAALGRVLELPYGRADKQMLEMMGDAMLDPQKAARMMQDPKTRAIAALFSQSGAPRLGYQAAPLVAIPTPPGSQ